MPKEKPPAQLAINERKTKAARSYKAVIKNSGVSDELVPPISRHKNESGIDQRGVRLNRRVILETWSRKSSRLEVGRRHRSTCEKRRSGKKHFRKGQQ